MIYKSKDEPQQPKVLIESKASLLTITAIYTSEWVEKWEEKKERGKEGTSDALSFFLFFAVCIASKHVAYIFRNTNVVIYTVSRHSKSIWYDFLMYNKIHFEKLYKKYLAFSLKKERKKNKLHTVSGPYDSILCSGSQNWFSYLNFQICCIIFVYETQMCRKKATRYLLLCSLVKRKSSRFGETCKWWQNCNNSFKAKCVLLVFYQNRFWNALKNHHPVYCK